MGVASGAPRFPGLSKMAKRSLLGEFGVHRMFMEGAICTGTDLNDEQTLWSTVS